MLNSTSLRPKSDNGQSAGNVRACAALLSFMLVMALAPAFGQGFTLSASTPSPFAILPNGTATSMLTLNSTSPDTVTLTCTVTPVQPSGTPVCQPSPVPVVSPAIATLTITTTNATPPALYTITITGTDNQAPPNTETAVVSLSVLAVTADYTLTVTTPVTPSSVHAGSGATAVLTVTSLNGYTGKVFLSCSAISPAVDFGPTCSFPGPVLVAGGGTQTGTLTITTSGTTTTPPTTSIPGHRIFYALWLPLPGLALAAVGCGKKKLLAPLAPCVFALILLLPSCGNNKSTTSTSTGVTPNNTYTFTLTGADSNALAPSNGTQSVTLTVN